MAKKFFVTISSLCLLFLAFPGLAIAQDATANADNCARLRATFEEYTGGVPEELAKQCAPPESFLLRVMRLLLWVAGSAAVLAIMFSGFRLVVTSQDSKSRATALTNLKWAVAGLALVLMATSIVAIVTRFLGSDSVL